MALVLLLPSLPAVNLSAQKASSVNSQASKRMAQAVDRTLKEGIQGKLPPHISTLLGLTKDEECPVVQGVIRSKGRVQGFDLSMLSKTDVVLFVVDEATGNQVLYLTSKTGVLRRVVKVHAGEGQVQKITAEDRKAFETEKQFWLDRLAPVSR